MEPSNSSQQVAQNILTILYPLLTSPQDATTRSIIAALRTFSAPVSVLANTLYIFSKLLPTNASADMRLTPQQTTFRNMIANLLHSNIISHAPLFECFDADALSLYVDASANHRNEEKRLRTRLWFTQTRFNLLREKSEGYAKVVTLLWEGISPYPPPVEFLIDDLIALIGQFSLDSNRVIELVLSAASDVVSELIAQSHVIPNDTRLPRLFCLLLDEFAPDHVYNVVGAMFQSYHPVQQFTNEPSASSDFPITDTDKKASRQFLGLVAVLIREGRMTVSDIWHHLSPRDNREVFHLFLHFEQELVDLSRTICSASPHALHDQAIDPAKLPHPGQGASDRDLLAQYRFISQGPFSNVQYQKLQLISQLIGMCRWPDAMSAILHLSVNNEHVDVAADPYIAVPISKFVEFLLSPVMNAMFPSFYPQHASITDAIDRLGGRSNGYPSPVRTIDQFLSHDPNAPGMYVREMLFVLGPYARVSTRLLYALCRLLKGRKEEEAFKIMRDVVLPASSLTHSNAGLASSIWSVLKDWSHTKRWEMYTYLRNKVCNSCAVYQVVAERASYEMRYILKRLTCETQRMHGNTVAKITHGQATAAFSATLDRVQGYPADPVTITPVIEACQNCSSLALDVLIFSVLDRMSDSSRSRLKEDGINVAQWYSTLSLFLGICLRKLPLLPQHIEGVIGFLYSKLVMEPEALLITALSDIIKCVADIEVDVNLTAKQIAAQGGGPYLQKIVSGVWGRLLPETSLVGSSFDLRAEREKKFAVHSLQEAFLKSGVHVWIGISIAQLTRTAVFDEDLKVMPLKLSANIVDRARFCLMQLSQFLDLVPPDSSFSEKVHKDLWGTLQSRRLTELITTMNVPTSSAVILLSPTLDFLSTSELNGQRSATSKNVVWGPKSDEAPSDRKVVSESNSKEADRKSERNTVQDGFMLNSTEKSNLKIPSKTGNQTGLSMSEDLLVSTIPIHFSTVISNRTKGRLSPMLVHAFWTLKFSDICVPESLYDSELKRMRSIKSLWEKEYERFRRHTHAETDRLRRVESELRLIQENTDTIEKEKSMIVKRHKVIVEKLKQLKKELCSPFSSGTKEERVENALYFVQECVLPKSRVSAPDALFCVKFVLLFLELGIPAIATTEFFEILLDLIPVILRSCSENEALSFSRLIKEVLHSLEKWRSNKKIFETEVQSVLRGGLQQVSKNGQSKPLCHEHYCQWLFDIHDRLTVGVCAVVTHREYLYSRNCLSILAGVAEVFPKVSEHSAKIEKCIAELSKSDLEDIRLSSNGVLARLRSGKAKRVPEFMFRLRPHSSHSVVNGNIRNGELSGMRELLVKSSSGKSDLNENISSLENDFVKAGSGGNKIKAIEGFPSSEHGSPVRGSPHGIVAVDTPELSLSAVNGSAANACNQPENGAQLKLGLVKKPSRENMQSSLQSSRPPLAKRLRVDRSHMHRSPVLEDVPNAKRVRLTGAKGNIAIGLPLSDALTKSQPPEVCTVPGQDKMNAVMTNNMEDATRSIEKATSPSLRPIALSPEVSVGINEHFVDGKSPEDLGMKKEIQVHGERCSGAPRAVGEKREDSGDITMKIGCGVPDDDQSNVAEDYCSQKIVSAPTVRSNSGKAGNTNIFKISNASATLKCLDVPKEASSSKDGDVSNNGLENSTICPQPIRGSKLSSDQDGSGQMKNEISEIGGDRKFYRDGTVFECGGTQRRTDSGESSGYRGGEKRILGAGGGFQVSRISNNLNSSPQAQNGTNKHVNGTGRGFVGFKRPIDDTQTDLVCDGNGLGADFGKRELNNSLGNQDMDVRKEAVASESRRGGETLEMQGTAILNRSGGTIDDGSIGKDGYGGSANDPKKRRRETDVRRRGRLDGGADFDQRRGGVDSPGSHLGTRYVGGNGISPRGGEGSGTGNGGGNASGSVYLQAGGYGGDQGWVGWSGPREDACRRRPETDNVGWQSRSRGGYDLGRHSSIPGSGVDRYRDRRDERRNHRDAGLDREIRGDPGRDRDHRDRDRVDHRRHSGGGNRRRRHIR